VKPRLSSVALAGLPSFKSGVIFTLCLFSEVNDIMAARISSTVRDASRFKTEQGQRFPEGKSKKTSFANRKDMNKSPQRKS
jgi:hypothetical protein